MKKETCYEELLENALTLCNPEDDVIARMANISSLIYHRLPHINWAGFYRSHEQQLILGPFQGKPACTPIAYGKGVCGTCAKEKTVQCVPNVHEFCGHIACDVDSKSEIVIPLMEKDTLIGVLDIDSDVYHQFDDVDIYYLSKLVKILLTHNVYENKIQPD